MQQSQGRVPYLLKITCTSFTWGRHGKLQSTHAHNTNTYKTDNIQEVAMCHWTS
jgi:hypothetical protein